jgi:hypothetical protein
VNSKPCPLENVAIARGEQVCLPARRRAMPETLEEWFAAYVDGFFRGEALLRVLAYMMNNCAHDVTDPVCSTLGLFLGTPVTFAVTTVGLIPFRNVSTAVFAYSGMSRSQQELLTGFVGFLHEQGLGTTSSQMGGSPVLSLGRTPGMTRPLEHAEVLGLFLQSVLANEAYPARAARLSVCNIVLQRLATTTNISRDTLHRLQANVLKPFETGAPKAHGDGCCSGGSDGDGGGGAGGGDGAGERAAGGGADGPGGAAA